MELFVLSCQFTETGEHDGSTLPVMPRLFDLRAGITRKHCTANVYPGHWALSDPHIRKEQPRYFPSDWTDRRIEWQKEHPGYDSFFPVVLLLSSESV
jgi:hypothetical protein